jgi:hypothetical protein
MASIPVQTILEAAEAIQRRVERCLHTQIGAPQLIAIQRSECERFLETVHQVCFML